ncbi:MAG: ABC transporter ATP-binding protein, partial [Actinomycetota bacterium]
MAFEGVSKRYPGADMDAVSSVDLEIRQGEFFSLLGPSGSGKTSCLRMVAGFETPTTGRILLDGVDVTGLPPYRRDVNTVFQGYALFPHMTVEQNVAYPLRMARRPRAEITHRVRETLALVELAGYERRLPHQLSGGQRQRVALGRALAGRPRVLLLDEPLGALDLQLRQQMQAVLKRLQAEVGITFVYVTHDQGEALSMSDRLAVMAAGSVRQVGTPDEIYHRPGTTFVAAFIGRTNLLRGVVESDGLVHIDGVTVPLAAGVPAGPADFSLRLESVRIDEPAQPGEVRLEAVVETVVFLGDTCEVVTRSAGLRLAGRRPGRAET